MSFITAVKRLVAGLVLLPGLAFSQATLGPGGGGVDASLLATICVPSTTSSPNTLCTAQDAAHTALRVKGVAAQSVNIFDLHDSAGATLFSIGSAGAALFQNATDSTTGFQVLDKDGNIALAIDTLSNPPRVGMGTAFPATVAHVVRGLEGTVPGSPALSTLIIQSNEFATSDALISLLAGTSGESIVEFADSGDRNIGFISYDHSNDGLTLGTNAAGRMTIDSSGNVTITGNVNAEPGGNIGPCKKYTKTFTDLTDADTEEDEVLFNLPARGKVWAVNIKHSVAFSGGGLSAMTVSVGDSSSPTFYAIAFDAFQAVADDKLQDGPSTPNFLSSTWAARDVFARFTSTGANMNAVTAGSVDIHVCWLVLPL